MFAPVPRPPQLIAAMAEAQAASVVKLGPWKLKTLAMRPAMQLASSPGMLSSVISGRRLPDALVQFAGDVAAHRLRQRGETGAFGQFARVFGKVHAQRR